MALLTPTRAVSCRSHLAPKVAQSKLLPSPAWRSKTAVASLVNDNQLQSKVIAGLLSMALTFAPHSVSARENGVLEARVEPVVAGKIVCEVSALDLFADTRSKFSMEASGGGMTEANVDIRGCDFSNLDLSKKVFSGVMMQRTDLHGTRLVGVEMARANAKGANFTDVDMTDCNCYSSSYDGANLQNAQFENSILTGSTFGKFEGEWANLAGAHFEGALLGSTDVVRICENPTLDEDTKKFELGCRKTR